MSRISHSVLLAGKEIGSLQQSHDYVQFHFTDRYWDDPHRHVLGLWFEDHFERRVGSNRTLPPWFSNLLPEGRLRDLIAHSRETSVVREMELLAEVGHDLPGAVTVLDGSGREYPWPAVMDENQEPGLIVNDSLIKFSLAGVQLKFSMVRDVDRFTLPASSKTLGHWIVKMPDRSHRGVPENEFAMMTLARKIGIDVPEIGLANRDETIGLPDQAWANGETEAFIIKRFDRVGSNDRVHIEDFAQVRNFRPDAKYHGSFETVAALAYRAHDQGSLHEFMRRMVLNVVIGNGDAHLKNWSFIYEDGRNPKLSPAYDIVSTLPYNKNDDLGLKFNDSRRFEDFNLTGVSALELKLGVAQDSLVNITKDTMAKIVSKWNPDQTHLTNIEVRDWVSRSIERWEKLLL